MGLARSWSTLGEYFKAGKLRNTWKEAFEELETFVIFLGYPRSGHSLVGSVLDAHPEAVIAHEQDLLRYLKYGFDRERLLALLMRNSMRFMEEGRHWSGYSYELPGQQQGSYRKLRVIGDKKGANSTRRLARKPELLERLHQKMGVPLRIVHVIRDPLDNVSRMALKNAEKMGGKPTRKDVREAMEEYFRLARTIGQLRREGWEDRFIDVHLEALIQDPRRELIKLQERLGLPHEEEQVEAASELLFSKPKRASEELEWPEDLRKELEERAYDPLR